ncbi:hypothetical protein M441DRAFT_76519, partial [Trichoderma asperellum CBS 433.97]
MPTFYLPRSAFSLLFLYLESGLWQSIPFHTSCTRACCGCKTLALPASHDVMLLGSYSKPCFEVFWSLSLQGGRVKIPVSP